MAKFSGKNIEFLDNQKAIFGSEDDSAIQWDNTNTQLTISTVVSGVDPTEPGHLVTRRYVDDEIATISGVPYVDGDDVYFYDSTRDKDLGVAVIQIGCGRNSSNTTNQYLRTFNGTPMNLTGVPLPYDATLVGIVMSGSRNDQSWAAQIGRNGVATVMTSLSITNAYENHTWSEDEDFLAGDRVQVRLSGSNINYPQVRLFFRRRK